MGGIAGILRLDGGDADVAMVQDMVRALAHRGPDGSAVYASGPIVLAHLAFHAAPEAAREGQPRSDDRAERWIVFDGRLDNRDELTRALGESPGASESGDAGLVLRAYARWGEEAVARLVGDFAFALWDARTRELVCARDALGIKPFYYRVDPSSFRFASELQALLSSSGRTPGAEPNEGFIGEFLAALPVHLEETVFRGILRLPAAHFVVVDAQGVRKRRYWEPTLAELTARTDREYGEQLAKILTTAVACRLPARATAGVLLSGGLDSSSVFTLAAHMRDAAGQTGGLESLSLVFPGRSYDESTYIKAVLEASRLPAHVLLGGKMEAESLLASLERSHDLPDAPTSEALLRPLLEVARDRGLRVILTGVGGDEWLQGSDFYHADLIRTGRWRTLAHLIRAAPGDLPFDRSWGLALRAGLLPLVPPSARRVARGVLGRRLVPRWIDPAFARRVDLEARVRRPPLTPWDGSYARADLRSRLDSGWEALMKEQLERGAAAYGLEYRHPFYDRRLVEFALALPEEQRQRATCGKVVLRAAMQGVLPEAVRQRVSKVHYSELYLRAFDALGGEACFARMRIEDAGWVDGDRVRRMYADAVRAAHAGDEGYADAMIPLWQILSVERWFRAIMGDNTWSDRRHPVAVVAEMQGSEGPMPRE